MNILITSVGRRAYIVKYFKEAIGRNGNVYVSNSDEKSIAFKYADRRVITPLIYDQEYIPFLLEYCKNNSIDIIISLFDIDLLMLAKHREDFERIGTKVIVSDSRVVEICNDKWMTFCFLSQNGFNTPKSFKNSSQVLSAIENGEIQFPIIVKPRFGCGSISISIAYDKEDLIYLSKKVNREINQTYLKYESATTDERIIYQECLDGQEYGADIINDLEGNVKNVIVRKKLAMRFGETDIAELVEASEIKEALFSLGKVTKHVANMDCDVFLVNNIPYILEMNARFGGGYPFSHMGGCDLPRAIVNWVEGKNVPLEMISAKKNVIGFKEIIITEM